MGRLARGGPRGGRRTGSCSASGAARRTTPGPGCWPRSGPGRRRPSPAAASPSPRHRDDALHRPAGRRRPARRRRPGPRHRRRDPAARPAGHECGRGPAQGCLGRAGPGARVGASATSPTCVGRTAAARPSSCSAGCRAASTARSAPGPPAASATRLLALGARRVSGVAEVLRECGFGVAAARSDLVVTGAGRVDWRTMRGSVVAGVAAATLETGRPTVLVAGECLVGRRETMSLGLAGTLCRRRHVRAASRRWSPTPCRRSPPAPRGWRAPGRRPADRHRHARGPRHGHPVDPTCHGTDRARERRPADVSLG